MNETDKTDSDKKKESATKGFALVIDATATFLKSVFPFGYMFVEKVRGKPKDHKTENQKESK